jgi:hypothetical protein
VFQRKPHRVNLAGHVAPDKVPALLRENQGYGVAIFLGHAE